MPGAAALGDTIEAQHESKETGETLNVTGTISGGCSGTVFIEGKAAAYVGSTTTETDDECAGKGVVSTGSGKVFINGQPAAREGDEIEGHENGTGTIASGSSKVTFN